MNVVSLFSGCGGLDLGFKEAGFDIIYACDNDPAAIECYEKNIDKSIYLRDVTSDAFHDDLRNIRHCDVVLGGFPCQGFSKAGPKQSSDVRNSLYLEMKNAVTVLQPEVFIAENVDGLSQNFKGLYINQICSDFEDIGYSVDYRILDAINYGLPQHRRRIIFVGVKQSGRLIFKWPTHTHAGVARNGESRLDSQAKHFLVDNLVLFDAPITEPSLAPVKVISDAIHDICSLSEKVSDHLVTDAWPKKYQSVFSKIGEGQKLCNVRHANTSVYTWQIPEIFGEVSERQLTILDTIARNRRHKKYGIIPNGNPVPLPEIERLSELHHIEPDIKDLESKNYLYFKDTGYELKGAMFCSGLFKRPKWGEPSPTVLTNFHNPRYFLHPLKDRPFSLRECARLQGFRDNFLFSGEQSQRHLVDGYRLVGNAVPPPMARVLADSVSTLLTENEEYNLNTVSEEICV